MANQSKRQARASVYVVSTALIALGAASLGAWTSPANAETTAMVVDGTVTPPSHTGGCSFGCGFGVLTGSSAGQPVTTANAFTVTNGSLPNNQLWDLQATGQSDPFGNPFVYIINKANGLALTVPENPRVAVGAPVVESRLNHGDNQKWLKGPEPSSPGAFFFANMRSGANLDATGPFNQTGAVIQGAQVTPWLLPGRTP